MFLFRFYFLVSYLVGVFSSEDAYRFRSFSLSGSSLFYRSPDAHILLSFTSPHHPVHPIYPSLHRIHGSHPSIAGLINACHIDAIRYCVDDRGIRAPATLQERRSQGFTSGFWLVLC
ncbi:hypothetical protein BJ165DRAFT_934041 [Panaeolus papilionaceus]|nr:hypothetical protein BJ165DRAFT_934041 [Panaeolus papilionaceus]